MKDDSGAEFLDPLDIKIGKEQIIVIGICFYCGDELTKKTKTKDHFRPTFRGKYKIPNNTVPCCRPCNVMKANLQPEEFYDKIKKIANNENFGKLINYAKPH